MLCKRTTTSRQQKNLTFPTPSSTATTMPLLRCSSQLGPLLLRVSSANICSAFRPDGDSGQGARLLHTGEAFHWQRRQQYGAVQQDPATPYLDITDGQGAVQDAEGEEGSKVLRHENGVETHHRNGSCKHTQPFVCVRSSDSLDYWPCPLLQGKQEQQSESLCR